MSVLYGFIDHEANMRERVVTIGIDVVYDMVAQSAAFYTEQSNQLYSKFIRQGTDIQRLVKLDNALSAQPITDVTKPRPARVDGQYTQGFPLSKAGTGWGLDRKSRHTMTLEDANRLSAAALTADKQWIKRQLLASIFTNASYTFTDQPYGDLTVRPLANNDTVTYFRVNGAATTANHYLAQSAAIADATNPFPTIYSTLQAYPANRGKDIIVYIADSLETSVTDLADFMPITDTMILAGIANDRLDVSRIPEVGPGEEIIGRVGKCWIAKWSDIPTGYMLAMVLNPDAPVIFQRNEVVPELQGYFTEIDPGDGTNTQISFIRHAGFAVYNRVGALAMRIGGASWADPTDLAQPLVA